MNILEIKKHCTGCAGCVDMCPVDALSLQLNDDGFFRPVLDNSKCIDCGKCVKTCPVISNDRIICEDQFFYGWNLDKQIRAASSSGGIFSGLASSFLNSNGLVIGAAYSEDFKDVCMLSTDEVSLESLRVSKYISANPTGMYREIREALKQGRKVMLTGTPCQTAAARRIFGTNPNLLLVDFICGGYPSRIAYNQYVCKLEKKYKSNIKALSFRDKVKGWSETRIGIVFQNGKKYNKNYQYDPYYYYYCTPYLKNEQCLDCIYHDHHESDITISDFWGYRAAKIKNDDLGMSLIAVHTKNGRKFLELAKPNFQLFDLDPALAEYGFLPKHTTETEKKERQAFLLDMKTKSFHYAAHKREFKGGEVGIILRKAYRRLKK